MLYNIAKSNKPRQFSNALTTNSETSDAESNLHFNNFRLTSEKFEVSNAFRASYHSIIKDNKIISLIAGVSDKYTGLPLNNVLFIIIPLKEDNNEILERETSGRGQFMVNNMKEGVFKIYIKKPGYAEQSFDIIMKNNLTLFLEAVLEKE